METRANHVLIGAFVLAVVAFALLFALWANRYQSDSAWRDYLVVFDEAVTGLSVGGAVQYNGIKVGEVRELSLDPDDPSKVLARIRLDSATPVKTDTVAKLALTGLTGVAVIQLSGGSADAPRLAPTPSGDPPVIVAQASALQKLLASSEDIATTVSEVLVRIRRVLSEENMARVGRIIMDIEQVTGTLGEQHENLGLLVADARAAAVALKETLAEAQSTIANVDDSVDAIDRALVDKLPELADSLQTSLAALESLSTTADAVLAENRESLSSFSSQGLAQIGPTLIELRGLLRELTQVADRLENDPTNFLLGRDKPKEFEP